MGATLADVPILNSLVPTPRRFFSQVPDYSQYGKHKREDQRTIPPVLVIAHPSPLHMGWDLFFILRLSYRKFTRFGKIA